MKARRFLIVDDDRLNNLVSTMVLKKSLEDAEVTPFVIPETGLEYIEFEFEQQPDGEKTTLFLDINMPSMTGWEFLEKFEKFKDALKKQFNIYILSSSVDPQDIHRAKINPRVIDFIEKPLNRTVLRKMFAEA